MSSFIIKGGCRLNGTITPKGAKNEALQVICATLLTDEEVTITNIPNIKDVNNLIDLLADMGVKVTRMGEGAYTFKADNIDLAYLNSEAFIKKCSSLRGSVMIVGPLVARFGKAIVAKPGGDKIGRRRLDTHFLGIQRLGANFTYDEEKHIYDFQHFHISSICCKQIISKSFTNHFVY